MSIENKLNYLKNTKNLIKNAIIDKGVDITPDTPFREYADKIGEISGGGDDPEVLAKLDTINGEVI